MEPEENKRDSQTKDEQMRSEVRAEIHFPESIEIKRTADQEGQHTTQKAIAVAAWAAFIAALCYAVIAQLQLGQMKEQTAQIYHQSEVENAGASWKAVESYQQIKNARQQVVAAQASADAISRQMRIDQRPWIKVELAGEPMGSERVAYGVVVGGPLMFPIKLTNTGKTPARNITADVMIDVVPKGQEPKLIRTISIHYKRTSPIPKRFQNKANLRPDDNFIVGRIFAGNHTIRNVTRFEIKNSAASPQVLSVDEANSIARKESYVLLDGQIHYSDIFGSNHWTRFCTTFFMDGTTRESAKCAHYAADDGN